MNNNFFLGSLIPKKYSRASKWVDTDPKQNVAASAENVATSAENIAAVDQTQNVDQEM